MQRRTFSFRTDGPYRVGAPSTSVAGAFEAVFSEDVKRVTLLTDDPAIIQAFGFASCGLSLNVEVDIPPRAVRAGSRSRSAATITTFSPSTRRALLWRQAARQ